MLCKRCMVVMKSGTSYEQKGSNGRGYKRYEECPNCHERVFNSTPNFQETLVRETEKNKNM